MSGVLIDADRAKIARYGIKVADVEAVVRAAIGGQAATQVMQGEKLFDLVVRMDPKFRSVAREIGNLLVPAPAADRYRFRSWQRSKNHTARLSFIAKIIRATSAFNIPSKDTI